MCKEELKPHKEAADKILGQVDDQLRKAMEQAAKYRLQHHKQRLLQQAKDEDQFVASTSHPKYAAIMGGKQTSDSIAPCFSIYHSSICVSLSICLQTSVYTQVHMCV